MNHGLKLNSLYLGLALAGSARALRTRNSDEAVPPATLAPLMVFFLLRTASLTQIETPEPRYVLEGFPALLALGAMLWAGTSARPKSPRPDR